MRKEEAEGLAEAEEDPSEHHELAAWLTTWLPSHHRELGPV